MNASDDSSHQQSWKTIGFLFFIFFFTFGMVSGMYLSQRMNASSSYARDIDTGSGGLHERKPKEEKKKKECDCSSIERCMGGRCVQYSDEGQAPGRAGCLPGLTVIKGKCSVPPPPTAPLVKPLKDIYYCCYKSPNDNRCPFESRGRSVYGTVEIYYGWFVRPCGDLVSKERSYSNCSLEFRKNGKKLFCSYP